MKKDSSKLFLRAWVLHIRNKNPHAKMVAMGVQGQRRVVAPRTFRALLLHRAVSIDVHSCTQTCKMKEK